MVLKMSLHFACVQRGAFKKACDKSKELCANAYDNYTRYGDGRDDGQLLFKLHFQF